MRPSRHAPINTNPIVCESNTHHPPQSDPIADGLNRLADSQDRLAKVLESIRDRLGGPAESLYTRPPNDPDLVDERTMAGMLNISNRTLAKYRRQGRLPGCWIRNSRRIMWKVTETQEAWDRGIS